MPRLRTLSGKEVVSILSRFGFAPIAQRGSHAKLRRTGPQGENQTLIVPLHAELDRGTLRAIFNQACRYVPVSELEKQFFSD